MCGSATLRANFLSLHFFLSSLPQVFLGYILSTPCSEQRKGGWPTHHFGICLHHHEMGCPHVAITQLDILPVLEFWCEIAT